MIGSFWTILYSTAISAAQGLQITGAWLLVVVPRIADAIDRTRTEREQIITERAAFDDFTKRVAALDPEDQTPWAKIDTHQSSTSPAVTAVVDQRKQTTDGSTGSVELTSVAVVKEAYRDTVMDVSHYENEYDESLNENLAAEFGASLAQTLSESDVMTPQLQAAILTQARQASNQRSDLLSLAETEYETLTEARRRLRDLHKTAETIEDDLHPRPVQEIVQSWNRLEKVATDCQSLLRERQEYLQSDLESRSVTRQSLQDYLYQPFQWEHPVLNDGLDTLQRIRRAKQKTVEAIYDW